MKRKCNKSQWPEHVNLVNVVVVVWQGIYDPGQTQEKDRDRGFILFPPQLAVLSRSYAGSDGVEPAPCFVIQNYQTHYSSRRPMYGTC